MNKNLLSSWGNFFLATIMALGLTGCKIGRHRPIVDYGKYRANIFFEFGKSELSAESHSNIDVIVATVKQFLSSAKRGKPRSVLIEIRGDASEEKSQKGKKANERIRKERAEKVASELNKLVENMGLKEVQIVVLDDKTPREEELIPEEAKEGYKRAMIDITFVENKLRGVRKTQIIDVPVKELEESSAQKAPAENSKDSKTPKAVKKVVKSTKKLFTRSKNKKNNKQK